MRLFQWLYSQPYLLLLLTPVFWGGNAVAGKLAVGHISPFLLTTMRWGAAVAIVIVFALPHLRRDLPAIRHRLAFLAMLGATGFTLFNVLLYSSLIYTTAINVAIIQASMPLVVFLLNFLLFGQRATSLQLAGFGLTLVGVGIIASGGSLEVLTSLAFNFGDVLILIAAFAYGIYSVLLRQKPEMHWLSFITILGASACLASLPFSAYEIATGALIWPDLLGWGVVFFTAFFPSILSQVFWMRGLELIGSNRGGIFMNLVPVFGALLAIAILGERFHLYHAIALVLVVGGVWLSQRRRRTAIAQ